jgi:hypothetical protein
MIHIRTAAESTKDDHPEWMKVIWEANKIAEEDGRGGMAVFGRPTIEKWWAGGTAEEYEHARVIHRGDGTVSVVAKTAIGDEVLEKAAQQLGLQHHHTIQEVRAHVSE